MRLFDPEAWHFDIDKWLNPLVPCPPWHILPYPISYFLGHRKGPLKPIGNLIMTAWAFLGIFLGLIVIELVTKQVSIFQQHHAPIIIASFGAGSVLQFYSIESPLAQPRNAVIGQFIASAVGVGICKLFALSPQFESIRWIGGALSCAIATALMALTKTVHPPAGATALLAVVSDDSLALGWLLIPMMLLGSVLMLIVALLINNFQRKFPQYWWSPEDLPPSGTRGKVTEDEPGDAQGADLEKNVSLTSPSHSEGSLDQPRIIIRRGTVHIPSHLYLTPEERLFLEELSDRI
ncbi:HPP family protein [Talaromyces stipitatus ATCC 10500]|uniref:HPP family protein n=1 Tax=Talaromyces stipitatus (strain ATCC 10500 / CBS 375.48 / QM 6759 / NRRL 1006) TaxID=441959 RepID=B8MR49_TALSN|nr:HPP family protein [Talaromyces stipitatus ATCC 10500]EED12944.1 HPP family protein [Talaromyces stipitatus ATCC 10500]